MVLSGLVLSLLVGCTGTESGDLFGREEAATNLPPERFVAVYPDVLPDRFHVIADFEVRSDRDRFQLMPDEAEGAVALSTERCREETGESALRIRLEDDQTRLVASRRPDPAALPADWTPYHLLLLSVHSPRRIEGFRVGLSSGESTPLYHEHPAFVLESGWNLLRVDLANWEAMIDLADVRQIRLSCQDLAEPVELHLDDVILADNTTTLYGEEDSLDEGDWLVQQVGRQLHVTSQGRFKLGFLQGRINRWSNLAGGAENPQDLSGPGSLGPSMVVLPETPGAVIGADDMSQWTGLGVAAQVIQRLAEANPLQVIIECEWRFGSPQSPPTESSPYHRWVYTIYPNGAIYVECSGIAKTASFDPPGLGVVFSCDGSLGFERHIVQEDNGDADDQADPASFVLLGRSEPGLADLLVVPFQPTPIKPLTGEDESRLAVLWPLTFFEDQFLFSAMLRVWPLELDSPALAAPRVADYCFPFPISVDVGQLVLTDGGDFDNDGFSEARGYYTVGLDAEQARIRIDGRKCQRFSPTFKIEDVRDLDVWVRVDGRPLGVTARTSQRDLLFQVPGPVTREILIEIAARPVRPEDESSSPTSPEDEEEPSS